MVANINILLVICWASCLYSQQIQSVLLENEILAIKTEGISFLGSGITEDDAKTLAINDAKRNALEQAGTYLESHTEVLNYVLVKDDIVTFTGSLLKVRLLNFGRALINNMFSLKVEIEATIDTRLLDQRIADIRKDRTLKKQFEAMRDRNKKLEARIAELQVSGNSILKQEVKQTVDAIVATEFYNKGFDINDNSQKVIYYSKSIELDPEFADAYNNRGAAYGKLGNHNTAIRDFSKAIEIDPRDAKAYYNRGGAYHKLGNSEEAIRDYSRAIRLDLTWDDAFYNLGCVYFDLGKHHVAIRDFTKVLGLNPQYIDAYFNRGISYAALGEYNLAVRDYTKVVELNPRYAKAYLNRGTTHYDLGNYETAILDLSKAIKIDSRMEFAYYLRGVIYNELHKYNSSIRDYTKVIELNPRHARAYFNRAGAYYELKRKKNAAEDFNKFLMLNGNKDGNAATVRQWIRNLGYKPKY